MTTRPTPAQDRARKAIAKVRGIAKRARWSPARIRVELRKKRCACPRIWRAIVLEVFGAHTKALPDMRQMPLF